MLNVLSIALLTLLTIFGNAIGIPKRFDDRIIGGVQVKRNELPYSISVQRVGSGHFCGAVIYNNEYILTAAHCLVDEEASNLRVVAGEHNLEGLDGTEQHRSVSSFKLHKFYNRITFENDIAVLKLSEPLQMNYAVASIKLPKPGQATSGVGTVCGWGSTELGSSIPASVLRKVKVPIIPDTDCKRFYADLDVTFTNTMMCAGFSKGGKDSCQGDSGGPLAVGTGEDRYLAGIVSWGYGCALPERPGVYTEVSHYIDFIETNTK